MISWSTGPIFTKCSPHGRYLIVDYRFDPLFLMAQGTCVCVGLQTNRNIAAGYVRKPRYTLVFRAAMPRRKSHASNTGFSLCHVLASAAPAAARH